MGTGVSHMSAAAPTVPPTFTDITVNYRFHTFCTTAELLQLKSYVARDTVECAVFWSTKDFVRGRLRQVVG